MTHRKRVGVVRTKRTRRSPSPSASRRRPPRSRYADGFHDRRWQDGPPREWADHHDQFLEWQLQGRGGQ